VTCFPSISRALRVSFGNGLWPPLTLSLRKHSGQKPRARQRAWPGYGAIPCTVRAVTGQIPGAAGHRRHARPQTACPLRARSAGQRRELTVTRGQPYTRAHLHTGRLTRCANRPSKQRVVDNAVTGLHSPLMPRERASQPPGPESRHRTRQERSLTVDRRPGEHPAATITRNTERGTGPIVAEPDQPAADRAIRQ